MNEVKHNPIKLSDYKPPEFHVDYIHLTFVLGEKDTVVKARSAIRRNPSFQGTDSLLRLSGEALELIDLFIDGDQVAAERLEMSEHSISIKNVPDAFSLEITTRLNPEANTTLSGLYLSSGNFCTQCEAEGFRRITYYLDRPDTLARFTTRIEAHTVKFPVLLSNGNLVARGELEHGYHFAEWEDPFPKPSYLFALVAGNLVSIEDTFTTHSGRKIDLQIYVQQKNRLKCSHAMDSLKKAMAWDEQVYGLEYDLDRYMIVAVDDFNMGAMENKGLNIFNSKYVLASPETATDQDYLGIEGVIAHEYFHNWTGNRVTCRDWFQLSLKEGLTVFRDQQFSGDMNSRAVQRIEDVRLLRMFQFREDAGPMAHPVRPESYMEINNFYTVTVYNKGAEVVRMIHSLLGPENFHRGMDLYFQRHDGEAVTCEDFVAAMSDASTIDLTQFKFWYSQAGTPLLSIKDNWNPSTGEYCLTISQSTPETPGQPDKKAFHIPILIGFLNSTGDDVSSDVDCVYDHRDGNILLELTRPEQRFSFTKLKAKPIVSFLRSFTAPVKTKPFHSKEELAFLMSYDSDLFNRWDAAFSLAESIILGLSDNFKRGEKPKIDTIFIEAIRCNLVDDSLDKSLAALALSLPSESYLSQAMEIADPDSLHAARQFVRQELARLLRFDFLETYQTNNFSDDFPLTPVEIGKRRLKNVCLDYLMTVAESKDDIVEICSKQYYGARNMTDQIAALSSVAQLQIPERDEFLKHFEEKWSSEPLVMDKWFAIQATSVAADTFGRVRRLMDHPAFSLKNPNRLRSLVGAFSTNYFHFNRVNGEGYRFLADIIIEIDDMNPQIAARLVSPLISWKRFDVRRRDMMKKALEKIKAKAHLSRDVFEIVQKSLDS